MKGGVIGQQIRTRRCAFIARAEVEFKHTVRDNVHLSSSSSSSSGISEIRCSLLVHWSEGLEIFGQLPIKLKPIGFSGNIFQGVVVVVVALSVAVVLVVAVIVVAATAVVVAVAAVIVVTVAVVVVVVVVSGSIVGGPKRCVDHNSSFVSSCPLNGARVLRQALCWPLGVKGCSSSRSLDRCSGCNYCVIVSIFSCTVAWSVPVGKGFWNIWISSALVCVSRNLQENQFWSCYIIPANLLVASACFFVRWKIRKQFADMVCAAGSNSRHRRSEKITCHPVICLFLEVSFGVILDTLCPH